MRIICIRTGEKYSEWYVDNLKYMLDKHSKISYTDFIVIRKEEFPVVWNKIQLFNIFKDDYNIYLDLDVCIKGKCNLTRKDGKLSIIDDRLIDEYSKKEWAEAPWHTPLNASIISWYGDYSFIYKKFINNQNLYMNKYRAEDEFFYKEIDCKKENFNSNVITIKRKEHLQEPKESIILFNQRKCLMEDDGWKTGWWHRYFIS